MLERIQYQDYLKCLKKIKKANLQYLKEKSESYELNNNKHEKEIIKIDKKHDKMFRNILCNKKEITLFLNQFLKIILITDNLLKFKIFQKIFNIIDVNFKITISSIFNKKTYFLNRQKNFLLHDFKFHQNEKAKISEKFIISIL